MYSVSLHNYRVGNLTQEPNSPVAAQFTTPEASEMVLARGRRAGKLSGKL